MALRASQIRGESVMNKEVNQQYKLQIIYIIKIQNEGYGVIDDLNYKQYKQTHGA